METLLKKPEVLAPAGDMERLIAAVQFGADAVYLGGQEFGMRAASANFDDQTLKTAVEYAHAHQVKVYLTCNTLPRNAEFERLPAFLQHAQSVGVDAFITTDLGVLSLIKQVTPDMEVHISTQAGIVNYASALAFYQMGAKRIVLARELSLAEITEIRARIPADMDIEVFVHGAMCMSFSGRCLLSNYLTGRDANRGECAQPCRWSYHLVEEKRPDQFFPIFEDEKGTYLLNSKDLCMIDYIDQLVKAGVTSFKIEGRAKSAYYVSVITNAYRMAVDAYCKDPAHFQLPAWLHEEVSKVSHRRYCTGFFFDAPSQYYENGGYLRNYDVVAVVEDYRDGMVYAIQKNKFSVGEQAEVLQPLSAPFPITITALFTESGENLVSACHPMEHIRFPLAQPVMVGSIVRMIRAERANGAV